ncbi:MAG TPA: NAD(P)/FAD-dependent oxidoreductase [Candidatus Binatia bacterium]|nr:NAD(P)/FAD-dependent oxidoreductase [Candidatus Binatia bacterium]
MINSTDQKTKKTSRVVIIGGGFGGLAAAQALKNAPVEITLIDRRNFHLFQPLLYQVATGWLSPANIASTLRATLKRQKNARVLLAEVIDIDVKARQVLLSDGVVDYDTLIVATGSRHYYFGNDDWEKIAPGLKTVEDATEIRRRIFVAFEAAERESDPQTLEALLTFVIVGGGPTGVELAGALGEIANDTLRHDFRNIDPSKARILLIEGSDRILPSYPAELSERATAFLAKLGVKADVKAVVTELQPGSVTVKRGESLERIPCRTVIWAAGVQASFLGQVIAKATGVKLDRAGRIVVEPDLTLAGYPEIFVIGDLANYSHQTGKPLPGVAPVAMQQGQYVARILQNRITGKSVAPFHYRDRGSMAIIGRGSAVAHIGRFQFTGFIAWLMWLFVHLVQLVEFENKILVLVQWGWYYFSRNRAARLITGDELPVLAPQQHDRAEESSHDLKRRAKSARG